MILPTLALQQVIGYLSYTGRNANVAAEVAPDPKPTFAQCAHRRVPFELEFCIAH
jgi:hypothetical protein